MLLLLLGAAPPLEARDTTILLYVQGHLRDALADGNMRQLLQGRLEAFSNSLAARGLPGPVPQFRVIQGDDQLAIRANGEWPDNYLAMLWEITVTADDVRFVPATSVDIGRSPLLSGRPNRFGGIRSIVSRRRLGDPQANEVASVEAMIEYAVTLWLMDNNIALVPAAADFLLLDQRNRPGTINLALSQSTGARSCLRSLRSWVSEIRRKAEDELQHPNPRAGAGPRSNPRGGARSRANLLPLGC